MKIGLILPTNLFFAPYLLIYKKILEANNIDYDVIYWNRMDIKEDGAIAYNYSAPLSSYKIKKMVDYFLFASFAKKKIKENKYDKLIVFGSQIGLFLYPFLRRKFRNDFILDFRDLSIEQIFKRRFNKLLKITGLNVISSPGFKRCLPSGYKYVLSHNFDIDLVRDSLYSDFNINKNQDKAQVKIYTVGGIRDYEANKEIIDSVKSNTSFLLKFIGKGPSADLLEKYVLDNGINNVFFEGYYEKVDEPAIIKEADFLNIYYPDIISHSTALSNRFYNSLIYKVPMIVKKNSIQGNYVEKYKLGVSLNSCDNMQQEIFSFISNNDSSIFMNNCNKLLKIFVAEYNDFESQVLSFMKS